MINKTTHLRVADAIVEFLIAKKIDKAFGVPGESYLDVLDAMVDKQDFEFVTCRQEGGAAMMAEAYAKLTNKPGVCMVTRGPGATNGSAGVHVAKQDSTPMLFFIGQVGSDMLGREAFQEIDYTQMFSDVAKAVVEINEPQRVFEYLDKAYSLATTGRKGPVVITLPENVLAVEVKHQTVKEHHEVIESVCRQAMEKITDLLRDAHHPVCIVGGGSWCEKTVAEMIKFSENHNLSVASAFRRQDYFPNSHQNYIGHLGLGVDKNLVQAIKQSDVILVLGSRLSEITTQAYTLFQDNDGQAIPSKIIHVHVDAAEINKTVIAELGIVATPLAFLENLNRSIITTEEHSFIDRVEQNQRLREGYMHFLEPVNNFGELQMSELIQYIQKSTGDKAILTNGAGNYAAWLHRFYQYNVYKSQLAPTSGSMGYGLPAAIAAASYYQQHDDTKKVICLAGDGCLMMTVQEIATAVMHDLNLMIIVINNSQYGTIRMHQEMHYPKRQSATALKNPNFTALAKAYGAQAACAESTKEFEKVFDELIDQQGVRLIEVILSEKVISVVNNGL